MSGGGNVEVSVGDRWRIENWRQGGDVESQREQDGHRISRTPPLTPLSSRASSSRTVLCALRSWPSAFFSEYSALPRERYADVSSGAIVVGAGVGGASGTLALAPSPLRPEEPEGCQRAWTRAKDRRGRVERTGPDRDGQRLEQVPACARARRLDLGGRRRRQRRHVELDPLAAAEPAVRALDLVGVVEVLGRRRGLPCAAARGEGSGVVRRVVARRLMPAEPLAAGVTHLEHHLEADADLGALIAGPELLLDQVRLEPGLAGFLLALAERPQLVGLRARLRRRRRPPALLLVRRRGRLGRGVGRDLGQEGVGHEVVLARVGHGGGRRL